MIFIKFILNSISENLLQVKFQKRNHRNITSYFKHSPETKNPISLRPYGATKSKTGKIRL